MNIDNRTGKIALACFLGASIGALVALQLGHHLWWLGMLVGGCIGYISYNFREIPHTVVAVWQELPEAKEITDGLRVFGKCSLEVTTFIVGLFSIISCEFAAVGACGVASDILSHRMNPATAFRQSGMWPGFLLFTTALVIVAMIGVFVMTRNGDNDAQDCRKAVLVLGLLFNPMSLLVTVPLAAAALGSYVAYELIKVGIKLIVAVFRTAKQTFLLVHSDIRLLCMTDAAFGALVGYLCGNALIGGLAGAISGVANYELVSKRLLKKRLQAFATARTNS
jgi:hypothetical protein